MAFSPILVFFVGMFLAMIPVLETKGAIPVVMSTAIWGDGALSATLAWLSATLGGIVVAFIAVAIFLPFRKLLERIPFLKRFFDSCDARVIEWLAKQSEKKRIRVLKKENKKAEKLSKKEQNSLYSAKNHEKTTKINKNTTFNLKNAPPNQTIQIDNKNLNLATSKQDDNTNNSTMQDLKNAIFHKKTSTMHIKKHNILSQSGITHKGNNYENTAFKNENSGTMQAENGINVRNITFGGSVENNVVDENSPKIDKKVQKIDKKQLKITKKQQKIDKKREKSAKKSQNNYIWGKFWIVFIFCALPIPLSGVWTAAALCSVLRLDVGRSILALTVANTIDSSLVALFCFTLEEYINLMMSIMMIVIVLVIVYQILKAIVNKLGIRN